MPNQVKRVKARLHGLVGVFQILAEQHAELSALLQRVQTNPEKRRELWPEIRTQLLAHERAEVRELFPILRGIAATRALADRHDEEANGLEQQILDLDCFAIDSDAWGSRFAELADMVIAHAEEEEAQIFPAAQEALGETVAKTLEGPVLRTEQQVAEAV